MNNTAKPHIMPTWITVLLAFVLHFSVFAVSAAPFKVSGTVTDETGEPLIGVSVKEVNNSTGVITDFDGKYTITLKAPGTLEFSYVGMEPVKIKVSGASTHDIEMKASANALDDVVVVGYGTQKKANLTGAVQSVSSDQIIRSNVSNGSSALQGVVPGLSAVVSSGAPGGDQANLKLRGQGSINSNTSPLVLIDGVEGNMNRIDLNSIESISVLKDAASASIYGSRASNGVILVTTKRGTQGKPKVTFNGYVGWNKPTEMPDPVDAVTYLTACDIANVNNDVAPQYTDIIEKYKTEGADNMNLYDTDWRDLVMKKSAMVQNYSVGVSGGSEFINIYANAGYYKQEGMVNNSEFQRSSLQLNADMKVNKWVKLGVDLGVRQAEVLAPIGGANESIGYAMTFAPIYSGINADGTWGYGLQGNNPVAAINAGGQSKSWAPQYKAKARITITPIKDLDILGSWSWVRDDGRTKTFAACYDQYESGVFKQRKPEVAAARESRSSQDFIMFNVMATYEKTIARKHYLKLTGVFESLEKKYNSLEGARNTFNYDGYEDLVHGDASTATNSTYRWDWAMLSWVYRLNYIFNDRYLFEANGRYDGTSRFLNNQRWNFFPSFSAGWRISEESFMKNTRSWLNNLKLRASWGVMGNQELTNSYYPYAAAISPGESFGYWFDKEFTTGAAQTQLANPLITWEKSYQYDFGLDWSMLDNRLVGTVDVYVRKITAMLQKFETPLFVALEAPWENAGSMRNVGWEFALDWHDRVGKLNYYARFNISDVRNKVLNLYGNEFKSGNRWTKEGMAYSQYYGYVAEGLFQSQEEIDASPVYGDRGVVKPGFIKFKDISGPDGVPDGVIDGNDRTKIGDPVPHFEYGLTLGGDWNNFDFSIFFQGVGKKDVAYTGGGARALMGNSTIYEHQLDAWSEDNKGAKYPLLMIDPNGSSSNNMFSSFWIKSAAYCRIKNLVVGYTIPRAISRKAQIERLRVYASAQNLFTFRADDFYKGFDPEQTAGATCYPLNKSFLVGLQLDF